MDWKKIEGYDKYEVSRCGQVRSFQYKQPRILKYGLHTDGYYQVVLHKNNQAKTMTVHRLVARAFIENPEMKPCIDHIDGNPQNNNVENLRWATDRENQRNRKISTRNTSGVKGVSWRKKMSKWQAQIMIDGIQIHIGYFDTVEEAAEARRRAANEAFGVFTNSCEKIYTNSVDDFESSQIS